MSATGTSARLLVALSTSLWRNNLKNRAVLGSVSIVRAGRGRDSIFTGFHRTVCGIQHPRTRSLAGLHGLFSAGHSKHGTPREGIN